MSEITPSVWQQNSQGEWKLYFNTESDLISSSSKSNQDQSKLKKINNLSEMNLVLGTLVMTPKGIGRLIKNNDNIATIRLNQDQKEEQFELNNISNNFNCFIILHSKGNKDIIRLKLKVAGKIEDIYTELEKIKKINLKDNNYILIYNKNKIKNEYTFEQLNILNNVKFLLLSKNNISYTVSRYINVRQYWYLYTVDGICFSPSQKIKLLGVGLFGSHENKIINATIKILDGPSTTSKIILEENIEIYPSSNKFNAITQIFFSRPVFCVQNQDYSVILYTKTNTNTFYGTNGKSYIDGEKGVKFFFKRVQGKSGGTGVETGNFPEFYYYLH